MSTPAPSVASPAEATECWLCGETSCDCEAAATDCSGVANPLERSSTEAVQCALASREVLTQRLLQAGVQSLHDNAQSWVVSHRQLVTHALQRLAAGDSDSEDEVWVSAVLVVALPLLDGALPRDQQGVSVVPHEHPLKKQTVPDSRRCYTETGYLAYDAGKVCDNCDQEIEDKHYWSCSLGRKCQVDFFCKCHEEVQSVLEDCDADHVQWTLQFVINIARLVLVTLSGKSRQSLITDWAHNWPTQLFQQLVGVVVDVANACAVHIQDNAHDAEGNALIGQATTFWQTVGLLELLYAANRLPRPQQSTFLDGLRIPDEQFVLEGLNKCEAFADYERWRELQGLSVLPHGEEGDESYPSYSNSDSSDGEDMEGEDMEGEGMEGVDVEAILSEFAAQLEGDGTASSDDSSDDDESDGNQEVCWALYEPADNCNHTAATQALNTSKDAPPNASQDSPPNTSKAAPVNTSQDEPWVDGRPTEEQVRQAARDVLAEHVANLNDLTTRKVQFPNQCPVNLNWVRIGA